MAMHVQTSFGFEREMSAPADPPVASVSGRKATLHIEIPFEDCLNESHRQLYIGDRARYSTVTSAQYLQEDLLVCGSFNGRSLHLVKLDLDRQTYALGKSVATTYEGAPVDTDLLAVDPSGEFFATSNFHQGTSTLYRHDGDGGIFYVRDLPFKVDGFVHGVKFYDKQTIAVTACNGPSGVHLFDVDTGRHLFHVSTRKAQDVSFVSPTRMIVVIVLGAPRFYVAPAYDAELQVIDFDLNTGTYNNVATRLFSQAHFDCGVVADGLFYVTDQYNNCIHVLDANTLESKHELSGYDFPHGIDVKYGTTAVTNYGTNAVIVRSI
jgi:hypothetical protein